MEAALRLENYECSGPSLTGGTEADRCGTRSDTFGREGRHAIIPRFPQRRSNSRPGYVRSVIRSEKIVQNLCAARLARGATQRLYSCPLELLFRFAIPARGRGRHSPPARKNLYRTCSSRSVQVLPNFVQLVLVLDQFCPSAQLFPPRLRATFKRKLKYETAHTIVHRRACPPQEGPPMAGSKGLPRVADLQVAGLPAAEGSKGGPRAAILPAGRPARRRRDTRPRRRHFHVLSARFGKKVNRYFSAVFFCEYKGKGGSTGKLR